ncbi:MAG TPA: twin-arginine translocase TatA/TatE family subunit [Phycisphaerales bacterium]|jgi:sec-independent protein translocase protein TatA|nr:twin-arginine translocase TatA/TatE family subunit [Phycisphaerales bacterium]
MPHLLQLLAPTSHTLALGLPSGWEWIVLLVLGLLIFGRRLPEVGRSLGRGIIEFKKGIKGIEEEIESESSAPAKPRQELPNQPPSQTASHSSAVGVEAGAGDK